jgi:hypothetical protein
MPNYAVPKPHSEKLRLINDHSVTKHSLNSMINHDQVVGFPMDSLARFGEKLKALRKAALNFHSQTSLFGSLIYQKLTVSVRFTLSGN